MPCDLLPPGEETGQILVRTRFADVQVEDTDLRYIVAGWQVCDLGRFRYNRFVYGQFVDRSTVPGAGVKPKILP